MNKTSHLVTLMLSMIILSALSITDAQANGYWRCATEPAQNFWEEQINQKSFTGKGTLCITPHGLWSSLKVRGLTRNNAYTVWWVYIDKPESCVNFPLPEGFELADGSTIPFAEPSGYAGGCGLADFFTLDPSGEFVNPLVTYGRMDSTVAGRHGKVRFYGELRSFTPSPGSQVWMFIFGHGPAKQDDKRELARQLLTPEDPLSGAPHLGIEGRGFGYPAGVVVFDIP